MPQEKTVSSGFSGVTEWYTTLLTVPLGVLSFLVLLLAPGTAFPVPF